MTRTAQIVSTARYVPGHVRGVAVQARREERRYLRRGLCLRVVSDGDRACCRTDLGQRRDKKRAGGRGLHDAQACRPERSGELLLRRWFGCGSAHLGQPAGLRRRRAAGGRQLSLELGHLFRRHLRAGQRGLGEGRANPGQAGEALSAGSQRGRLATPVQASCGRERFHSDRRGQILFTQVRKPTIAVAAERCGVPVEKCHTIMEKYGYTGSACIAMALDDAIELGKIKRGDLVVMIGSGVGYNQAAAAVRMT